MNTTCAPMMGVALMVVLAGCGSQSRALPTDGQQAQASGERPEPGTGADAYQYLLEFTRFAPYRTGTSGDIAMSDWVAAELRAMGYEVRIDEYPFTRFEPLDYSLDVEGFRPAVFPIYYSGLTSAQGVSGPIVDVGLGTPVETAAAAGAIALVQVPYVSAIGAAVAQQYDSMVRSVAAAGAKALVVAFQGPENEIVAKNVSADAGLCGLPILLVGKQDGAALSERAGQMARFVLNGRLQPSHFRNVVATRTGRNQDVILVGTPMNPWFTSAAERGAGVGGLLTLARHFDRLENVEPTLMFIASGAHEVGFLGLAAFADSNADLLPRIGTYVHLGASLAAKDFVEVDGQAMETGAGNAITLFISENPVLQPLAQAAFRTHGVIASTSPPSVLNPGEQNHMYVRNVPIAAISATHFYFHTLRDLPDLTSGERLDPVIAGYRDLITDLLSVPAETMRLANTAAENLDRPTAAPTCLVPAQD